MKKKTSGRQIRRPEKIGTTLKVLVIGVSLVLSMILGSFLGLSLSDYIDSKYQYQQQQKIE